MGWVHTLIAPPTDPRPPPAPGAGSGPPRRRDPKPSTSHRTKAWRHAKAGQPATGGVTSRACGAVPRDGHRVGDGRHLAPRPCPLLPLAVGAAPLAAHQGMVSDMVVLPPRPAAVGGHPPARTDGRDPHCAEPVPRLCDPPDPGAGAGRATAAHHPH